MALSQADRISISKKILDIPKEDATSADNKVKLEVVRVKAQAVDDANKSLFDTKNAFVNQYQNEIKRLDGNDRTEILEQDIIDTSVNKQGNFFSPNQPSIPTPSLPTGVWTQFIPFANNKALGKNYLEVSPATVTKEGDDITSLNGFITTMEGYSAIGRSSGQSCGASGTCSLPQYTTQVTCEAATPTPGVWTPGPDVIANDSAIQATATSLISAVNTWRAFIQAHIPFVTTNDPIPATQAQNDAELADIAAATAVIDTWLARPSFDTAHGQTTCVGFNSYNVALLSATKFRAAELQLLKDEITARLSYITTRTSQIGVNLGSITQNLTTGALSSATGLYGARMNILNLRLNLMNGSLRKLQGIMLGQKAQDEAVASNVSATSVYTSVVLCTAFVAPALNSPIINVKSAAGFSVSDAVYIASDTQAEISTTILAIAGNMVTLAAVISSNYKQNELARLYKAL